MPSYASARATAARACRLRALCLLLLLAAFPLVRVQAADTSIALSYLRAIRVSDSSISLSFLTEQETIGSVEYVGADGTKFTLTDSTPQRDHLFTIDSLDALHPYSFKLSASEGGAGSNTSVVLISPDSIGPPGQSIVPGTQVISPQGALIASSLSASSTPNPQTTLSPWIFVAFAGVAALVTIGNRVFGAMRSRVG